MTREKLQRLIEDFTDNSQVNYLGLALSADEESKYGKYGSPVIGKPDEVVEKGIVDEFRGMRFFMHPIFSVTRADDPGFAEIKRPEVVGEHHLMPYDWLPEAKTVLSFFLPINRDTVEANKKDPSVPAREWLCTRVDGQRSLMSLGAYVSEALVTDGHKAIAPITSPRYIMRVAEETMPEGAGHVPKFSTNWSERHVAVVTGLGTFGLSTNFISRVGCAGRLVSVVTDWDIEPDARDYDDWLGYCNRCGACIAKCKGEAHFKDRPGKDHSVCSAFMGKIRQANLEHYAARYGCGKCQSGIPCEYEAKKA